MVRANQHWTCAQHHLIRQHVTPRSLVPEDCERRDRPERDDLRPDWRAGSIFHTSSIGADLRKEYLGLDLSIFQ